ncbi:MAG: DNA-binding protein [Microbacterium sp.]|nr:helix-turn-helix domain-containing protein [Micrococcales bacterium]PZU44047.1 MAG: DNA-binding protein [Microbacterium sp.]
MLGGIGRSKLFEEINAGRIRAVKIGRRTFVAHAELERYVAGLSA